MKNWDIKTYTTSTSKKRLFVTNMVNLAHSMSVLVIANGIQNMKEYFLCKDLGCDFVQGSFIQPATNNPQLLKFSSDKIAAYSKSDRRESSAEEKLITEHLCYIPPIRINATMMTVFDYFKPFNDNYGLRAGDRHGNRRQFSLLSCCAAVFQLTPDRQTDSTESIFRELARLKKLAKYSGEDGIYVRKVY